MKQWIQAALAGTALSAGSLSPRVRSLDGLVESSGRPRAPFGCVETVPQHFEPKLVEGSAPPIPGQDVARTIRAMELLRILGGPGGAARESVSPAAIRRLAKRRADGSPGALLVGDGLEPGINCFVSGDALAVVGWNGSGKYWTLWFFPLEGPCRIPAGSRAFVATPLSRRKP